MSSDTVAAITAVAAKRPNPESDGTRLASTVANPAVSTNPPSTTAEPVS